MSGSSFVRGGARRRLQSVVPPETRSGRGDESSGEGEDEEAGTREAHDGSPGPSGERGGEGDENCRRLIRQQYRELISTVQREWLSRRVSLPPRSLVQAWTG